MSSGELQELLEAIRTGRNHPLLLLWKQQRSYYRSRPSPPTILREQRSTCVWHVRALNEVGLSLEQAQMLVTVAANKSGAFEKDITARAVRDWENHECEKVEPQWLVVHHEHDPVRIIAGLIRTLSLNALDPSFND